MTDFNLTGWPDGVNNTDREDRLGTSALRKGVNVDLLEGGKPRRRAGYERLHAFTSPHSLYSTGEALLFVSQGVLYRFDGLVAPEQIATGLASFVSYAEVNNEIYLTDGTQNLVLGSDGTVKLLGLAMPLGQPALSANAAGGLYEGRYQVAITYVNDEGMESGTGQAAAIDIPEGGGIALTNIPQSQDQGVVSIRIYASEANGENLYYRTSISPGVTSFNLNVHQPQKLLDSMFKNRLPAGKDICFFNGRVYVGGSKFIHISDPLDYGRYSLLDGYYCLPDNIVALLPVDRGIFVGTDKKVVFLQGDRPDNFTLTTVAQSAMVPDTGTFVDGAFFDQELAGQTLAVWWTAEGVLYLGLESGDVRKIREADLVLPEFESGTVAEVDRQGVKQLLSVLKNPGPDSSLGFGDSIEIEVHKHGITL